MGGSRRWTKRADKSMNQFPEIVARPPGQAPLNPFDTDVQSHIGRQLRALYDGVVSQPIPDRFIELLEQLEEKAAVSEGTEGGGDKEPR